MAHRADVRRRKAEAFAKETLQQQQKISSEDVTAALELWGFSEKNNRANATRPGTSVVHSDTLGLVRDYGAKVQVASATLAFPNFTRLLVKWLRDQMPAPLFKLEFPFTSITVNENFRCDRHRDKNNMGPSLIRALGDFRRGRLQYFPSDMDPQKNEKGLSIDDRVSIDVQSEWVLFDGRRCHEVEAFDGHRFSVVAFSNSQADTATEDVRTMLSSVGIQCPTAKQMSRVQDYLGKATPGYRAFACSDGHSLVSLVSQTARHKANEEVRQQAKQAALILLEAKFDRKKVTTARLPVAIYNKNVGKLRTRLEEMQAEVRAPAQTILDAMSKVTDGRRTTGPWKTQFMRGPWKKYALGVFRVLGGTDSEMLKLMARFKISSAEVSDACKMTCLPLQLPAYVPPHVGKAGAAGSSTHSVIGDFVLHDTGLAKPKRGFIAIDTNLAGEMAEFREGVRRLDGLIARHQPAKMRPKLARIVDFMCALGRSSSLGFSAQRGFDSKTVGTWRRFLILLLFALKLPAEARQAMKTYRVRPQIVQAAREQLRSRKGAGRRSPILSDPVAPRMAAQAKKRSAQTAGIV